MKECTTISIFLWVFSALSCAAGPRGKIFGSVLLDQVFSVMATEGGSKCQLASPPERPVKSISTYRCGEAVVVVSTNSKNEVDGMSIQSYRGQLPTTASERRKWTTSFEQRFQRTFDNGRCSSHDESAIRITKCGYQGLEMTIKDETERRKDLLVSIRIEKAAD